MIFENTTLNNKSKVPKLKEAFYVPEYANSQIELIDECKKLLKVGHSLKEILYSLGIKMTFSKASANSNYQEFIQSLDINIIETPSIKHFSFDLLGAVYQGLNSKYDNLGEGRFYTSEKLSKRMTKDLTFSNGEVIFDPACGSGNFLFSSPASSNQIFGIDKDPIAVMICKFNYFLKFPFGDSPNIFQTDFFKWYKMHKNKKYDYIIFNPPYGVSVDTKSFSETNICSGESFSYFTELSYNLLKDSGTLKVLLPVSALNVKKHKDLRKFLIYTANLTQVKRVKESFAGVMSPVAIVELNKKNQDIFFFKESNKIRVDKSVIKRMPSLVISPFSQKDKNIITRIEEKASCDLSTSEYALGLVTGNNTKYLLDFQEEGSEPIYTGKEIASSFSFLPPKKFMHYNRSAFQQVAPDSFYRAPEKLVYKVISKNLKFVYDDSRSLTVNSANILLPDKKIDIFFLLGYLNSNVCNFYYLKIFGGVNKVAKTALKKIPIPFVSPGLLKTISNYVSNHLFETNHTALNKMIEEEVFNFSEKESNFIKCCCGGSMSPMGY